MAYHPKFHTQNCPECGKQLISVTTVMDDLGSPLIVCPMCGKTSYTRLRREWYNYPDKDVLWLFLLVLAIGIGAMIEGHFDPESLLFGGLMVLFVLVFGLVAAVRIVKSKRRMRDPEYLAELLRWQIIRQEEYEYFMRNAKQ